VAADAGKAKTAAATSATTGIAMYFFVSFIR
jgi:hypothetical protein